MKYLIFSSKYLRVIIENIGNVGKVILNFLKRSFFILLVDKKLHQKQEQTPGLILLQIDGFSKHHLDMAMKKKKLKFINSLIKNKGYRKYSFYSGVPSTTPSVQGELFYGKKMVVPAFQFYDSKQNKIVTMFDSESVKKIEQKLSENSKGLLAGGSSYSNIFTGDCIESHFCMSRLNITSFHHNLGSLAFILMIFPHVFRFLKVFCLIFIELFLSLYDFARGYWRGFSVGKELKLILSRIGVTIIMRELIVMGAKIDIARGLPIIHANFLGYDEHSHRRNPSSKVTFWTLKGTDKSIGEIWKAAELSKKRHYDVWIYSDHGQEYCTPYERKYGHSLSEAVASVIKKRNKKFYKRKINAGIQVKRVGFFRNKPVSNDSFNESINSISEERPFVITALGPLGFLYLIGQMNLKKKRKLAKDLVAKAKIPIVFYRVENNIFVENLRGSLELPRDKEKVFGSHHPFLTNVTEDMIELCMHQNSGDFVLSGYNLFGKSLSFVMEYGAHGGPGRYETEGFLLVPGRAACFSQANDSIRPIDLREGVISYLNQETNFSEVSLKEKKIV